jgi:hypothetical protein
VGEGTRFTITVPPGDKHARPPQGAASG